MARSETNRPKSPASSAEASRTAASRTRRTKSPEADDAPKVQGVAQVTADPSAAAESPAVQDAAAVPAETKRFDIFVIDIGWKSAVAEALRNNLNTCLRFQRSSTVYILSHDQCSQFVHKHPSVIGTEPSIVIIDREARAAKRPQGFGFKMNFGLIRDVPSANNLLKWVLAVLSEQKPGSDVTEPIRTVLHKEGIRGAIDILADIAHSPVGEAMTH
jgi:hypothetical protein